MSKQVTLTADEKMALRFLHSYPKGRPTDKKVDPVFYAAIQKLIEKGLAYENKPGYFSAGKQGAK